MLFSTIVRDRHFSITAGLGFLILFLAAALFYVGIEPTGKPLILHFDSYRGIDFLGSRWQVFKIIWSAFFILLINFLLGWFLYDKHRFLSYIFVFASLWISVLILIAVNVIISANT
jgi:hypothetical protein